MNSKELVFFGRIAASFTHELKNVLAIVKETSGLMEDILAITQDAAFPHKERFSRAVVTIQSQVGRGVELANRMNRFAHAPDHAVAAVELNDIVEQVTLLAERLARVKGVGIKASPVPEGVNLVSSPVGIQLTLFKAMECCWTAMESGAGVEAKVHAGPPPFVTFACADDAGGSAEVSNRLRDSALWQELQEAARGIGATIREDSPDGLFTLMFPVTLGGE
jgi:signal transduction histidine kinase